MLTSSNCNIFRVTGPLCGSQVNSPHKGQWRGALVFSLMCAWINVGVNNREDGDLRHHRVHYDKFDNNSISIDHRKPFIMSRNLRNGTRYTWSLTCRFKNSTFEAGSSTPYMNWFIASIQSNYLSQTKAKQINTYNIRNMYATAT